MDILILLVYSLFCWSLFKIFKVPVNKWTLTTAVLGGILFIATIVLLMNYNHPYTSNSRTYFVSTPVIPNVAGQVNSVNVGIEQDVKEGDTLFTLDATPYKSRVQALQADLHLAKTRLDESKRLYAAHAGSAYDVEMYTAQIDKLKASLIEAKWNVDQCIVLAPGNGRISQMRLREGMRATPFPLRAMMTFIDTDKQFLVAAIPQNPMQRVEVGDVTEIAFDAIPGQVFKGKVNIIGSVIAQGEIQTNGTLKNFDEGVQHGHVPQGSVPVLIEVTDDISGYTLPGGAKSQVAIYTKHVHAVKVVRMVLIRMKGWLNYLFGEH